MGYTVERVITEWGVFDEKGRLIVLCNLKQNALLMASILIMDSQEKFFKEVKHG